MYGRESLPVRYTVAPGYESVYADDLPGMHLFSVHEQDPPPWDVGLESSISMRAYLWGLAFAEAVTHAAINCRSFPGAQMGGSAYYAEQSLRMDQTKVEFNRLVLDALRDFVNNRKRNQANENIAVLEIGAQQAQWAQAKILPKIPNINHWMAFDLSYANRYSSQKPLRRVRPTFIEGDAHFLSSQSLPHTPDVMIVLNALDLMYDPILILRHVWDVLAEDGLFILGENATKTRLPLLLSSSEDELILTRKLGPQPSFYQAVMDVERLMKEWSASSRELVKTINLLDPFFYSSVGSWNMDSDSLSRVMQFLYKQLPMIQTVALPHALRRLGISVEQMFADKQHEWGEVMVIHKNGQPNPFSAERAPAIGFSSTSYHVDEYKFLNVVRAMTVPNENHS